MGKTYKVGTKAQRDNLPVRREPYWTQLVSRGYLGFRRTEGGGTWIARYRLPTGKQEYHALKLAPNIPDDEARDAAAKLAIKHFEELAGGSVQPGSGGYKLSTAADTYLKGLRAKKGEGAAKDAEGRIKRHLETSPLWSKRVDRLTSEDIQDWLYALVPAGLDDEGTRKAKDSANRNLTTLKAILNHAWRLQRVSSPNAWAVVQPFNNVAASRRVFLTLEQRRRLLEVTEGAFRDLIEAAMLTGARYGELRQLVVEDFDKANRTLEVHKGKTGPRTVALTNDANALFSRLAKSKLPSAPLLPRPDGQPWQHSDQDELMRAAAKKAKLPKAAVFYSLRHSHIASALSGGVDINTVAKNTGTSVRIIETNYSKFIPADVSSKMSKVQFA